MTKKLDKTDKLSIITVTVLIIAILSSFLNFGIISVIFTVVIPLIFIVNCALAVYGIFKKKYFPLIGVVFFLLFYNFFYQFSSVQNIDNQNSISILTYNIREFKQYPSVSEHQIITFIKSLNPDILVFQESSYKEGTKLENYPYIFLGFREEIDKSLLAIYSKYPIINTGYIDFDDTMNNAIYADIKLPQDTIRIYNTHLQSFVFNQHIIADNYRDYSYLKNLNHTITKQIEQAKLVKNHANKSTKKVIICGDFNATPYSQPYRILKKEMNDSYVSHGNGFGKTYSLFNYPLRLDYFLSNDQIEVLNHQNFELNVSDHEPVYVKFKIK